MKIKFIFIKILCFYFESNMFIITNIIIMDTRIRNTRHIYILISGCFACRPAHLSYLNKEMCSLTGIQTALFFVGRNHCSIWRVLPRGYRERHHSFMRYFPFYRKYTSSFSLKQNRETCGRLFQI